MGKQKYNMGNDPQSKSLPLRSLTTRPDFCLVVSRRVVDPTHITRNCRVVSCRVVSCNVRWALRALNQ